MSITRKHTILNCLNFIVGDERSNIELGHKFGQISFHQSSSCGCDYLGEKTWLGMIEYDEKEKNLPRNEFKSIHTKDETRVESHTRMWSS